MLIYEEAPTETGAAWLCSITVLIGCTTVVTRDLVLTASMMLVLTSQPRRVSQDCSNPQADAISSVIVRQVSIVFIRSTYERLLSMFT
jgi:hypothetical protein